MVDLDRLQAAYHASRSDLLSEREPAGHWVGELSSSPLATATAISALVLAEQHGRRSGEAFSPDQVYQGDLSELVVDSIHWLARHQNEDGGWGDTDKSLSNIAATMLVRAAFHLTGVPVKYADLLQRADAYIKSQGDIAGLRRRYGQDKTFAVPILTNCALAELVPWRKVSPLPFELACLPQSFYRFLHLPVVSYAIPALVAVGQARYFHHKPLNPITRMVRAASVERSLQVLQRMQPASGGFLEAVPLTSFVVMSLASIGRADHPVTRRSVEFLLASVRSDGSWAIDTNLATWNTTQAVNALAAAGEDVSRLEGLDWLLGCQHRRKHPFTGAVGGGWSWTDLSGGVPDADDTAGALLALAAWQRGATTDDRDRIQHAARAGVRWLLGLQNRDGGWPTFCRGWGKLPFDRSGCDLTAHVLRSLAAWRGALVSHTTNLEENQFLAELKSQIDAATETGMEYLTRRQRADGSWVPLWFGNQHQPAEENPIYGTARVLAAFRDLNRMQSGPARRGVEWLAGAQQADGGWGGGPAATEKGFADQASSVEETALALEALLAWHGDASLQVAIDQGVGWLVDAVLDGRHRKSSPLGFYFAKLWYYERLYPMIHTVSALGQAVARLQPQGEPAPTTTARPGRT